MQEENFSFMENSSIFMQAQIIAKKQKQRTNNTHKNKPKKNSIVTKLFPKLQTRPNHIWSLLTVYFVPNILEGYF
jgi:hypothetical protein